MQEKINEGLSADAEEGQSGLKKAIIAFAVVEALVLTAIVLYRILR